MRREPEVDIAGEEQSREEDGAELLRRISRVRAELNVVRTYLRGLGGDKSDDRELVGVLEFLEHMERKALRHLADKRLGNGG